MSFALGLGAQRKDLWVYVGPCISARRYKHAEYGPRVRWFENREAMYVQDGVYHLDLQVVISQELLQVGLRRDRLFFDGRCTYDTPELSSHRRTVEKEGCGFQRGNHVMVGWL